MARFKDNNISGAVGNIIFYTMDGKNYVRSKPGKRRKKRGQKPDPNTSIFGIVSTNSARMLKHLKPQMLFHFSLGTYNNARAWMRNHYAANHILPQWDITARPNDMCQLNTLADLRDMLFASIAVSDTGNGKLLVNIPVMNPVQDMKKLPAGTTAVNIKLAAVYPVFKDNSFVQLTIENYTFNYENTLLPAKEIMINTGTAAGDIAILVIAIEPVTPGKTIAAVWLPAAIIAMGKIKQ